MWLLLCVEQGFLKASSSQEVILIPFAPLLDSQPSHQGQTQTQLPLESLPWTNRHGHTAGAGGFSIHASNLSWEPRMQRLPCTGRVTNPTRVPQSRTSQTPVPES